MQIYKIYHHHIQNQRQENEQRTNANRVAQEMGIQHPLQIPALQYKSYLLQLCPQKVAREAVKLIQANA